MKKILDYGEAISLAANLGSEGITPSIWIPKKEFAYAIKNSDGSISFTRKDSPRFGIGVGTNPIIDDTWDYFALPKNLAKEKTLQFKLINRWHPYQIDTSNFSDFYGVEEVGESGLAEFLNTNAPESSVYPGNEETIFWAGKKINGDLVAIGSINKWESGEYVMSSIATKISERNKGYGSEITKGILAICNQKGIRRVALAVNAKNEIAARVYERIGFKSLGQFNTFERQI